MSTITKEQAKDLRNAFQCWQQDYDPVEDKEQYDMFGLGMVAMDALLASLEADDSGRNPVQAYADSYRDMAKQGVESIPVWSVITDLERNIAPLYTAQPAAVVHDGHSSVIAEQLAHVLSGMEATDHQRAIISCAVDRLNHNAEILQKAPTAQEAILYEPSPTDSVNAPLKFTDVEDRAWVVGAEWMRDAFKRENPHLRIANDNDPAPASVPDELTREEYKRRFMEEDNFDDTFRGGWSACRAAMLQGAEPVTTANELPFEQWLSQQTGTIDVECGCVMTEVFFHWLRVAYEAGNSPVTPDGWVLVPEEPTHEMLEAGDEQFGTYDVYRRMIAASPQQK
ncbi:hypothetical protein LWU40_01430 [Enterobacter hormaechei]|nr:hypothetical protein [Enterobacter hormaechei]